ncbi:maltokinase N-terminal cap-like domain-containing protein [Streptomyces alkaliterrae]|uniref:Maltokinase n=1 Tax=Streptomyces alkaliterrae TaxID=2213162 RepID=A0A5P0YZ96_9ACTN|nr:phosphotransferase [Streptomyces alkaliterrae]MBB1256982.1 phosphotransferase [Streptomyces alkaliterrae]MBB1262448.1 phosphotransferase [Streptomyces alkaliterrae]MQS05360.1 phosphotransferase [Streptomyces alkaliterrae]
MPDSSTSRIALPDTAGGAALLHSIGPMLTSWLPRQRWFAGKGRPLDGLTLAAATELLPVAGGPAPGLLHLLVTAHQGRTTDCYQLLLGVRHVLPPVLAPALIGRPEEGALRGMCVYDAVPDPRLTSVLLERLRAPGRLGALGFRREPGTAIPSGLVPRPLRSEQSNSSVVYGDTFILKLFRRLSPGLNPDLELPLALARAGCRQAPAPVAWFEAENPVRTDTDATLTLGILQPYLAGTSDGWQLALRALAAGREFHRSAFELGRATAAVHTALAAALPTSVLAGAELTAVAEEMTERLERAVEAVPALRPYRPGLREAFRAVATLARTGHQCPVQRIHGDLHLGQVLRTDAVGVDAHDKDDGGSWALIDFEGEPAVPIAERRRPQPVLRDVAGMLRSFDYAACQRGSGDRRHRWAAANRAAYCAGYASATGADPHAQAALLRVYETDKAVYEVLYEARHRPNWLPIPMAAIRRLAQDPK